MEKQIIMSKEKFLKLIDDFIEKNFKKDEDLNNSYVKDFFEEEKEKINKINKNSDIIDVEDVIINLHIDVTSTYFSLKAKKKLFSYEELSMINMMLEFFIGVFYKHIKSSIEEDEEDNEVENKSGNA